MQLGDLNKREVHSFAVWRIVQTSLAHSQTKISLNWLASTEAKITFKALKLAIARADSFLDQVSSDLEVDTSFVVTIKNCPTSQYGMPCRFINDFDIILNSDFPTMRAL